MQQSCMFFPHFTLALFLSVTGDIIKSTSCSFQLECLWNILFKKCGISNQPVTASAMIRVFPSLEHSTDCVRKPADNFRTFVCPLLSVACRTHSGRVQTWKRHGIRCSHPAGRNTHIFLQRMFHMQFQPKSVSSASCNITYHSKLLTCFVRQLLSDGSVPRSIHMQMLLILP